MRSIECSEPGSDPRRGLSLGRASATIALAVALLGEAAAAQSGGRPPEATGRSAQATTSAAGEAVRPAGGLYVPPAPDGRLAGGRVGGGTRSSKPTSCDTKVIVIAPDDHAGLTLEAQPTLYYFLSRDTDCSAVFVLNDRRQVPPRVEAPVTSSGKAGLHAIRLADFDVSLEPGIEYDWFVRMKGNPAGGADPFSGGQIRRVAEPEGIADALSRPGARKTEVLGRSSIWYDTVAALTAEMEATPGKEALRQERAALFGSVGLEDALPVP